MNLTTPTTSTVDYAVMKLRGVLRRYKSQSGTNISMIPAIDRVRATSGKTYKLNNLT